MRQQAASAWRWDGGFGRTAELQVAARWGQYAGVIPAPSCCADRCGSSGGSRSSRASELSSAMTRQWRPVVSGHAVKGPGDEDLAGTLRRVGCVSPVFEREAGRVASRCEWLALAGTPGRIVRQLRTACSAVSVRYDRPVDGRGGRGCMPFLTGGSVMFRCLVLAVVRQVSCDGVGGCTDRWQHRQRSA